MISEGGHGSSDPVASTGLGLYIAHQIVRAHGGRLEVASIAKDGTTFTFVLPIAAAPLDLS